MFKLVLHNTLREKCKCSLFNESSKLTALTFMEMSKYIESSRPDRDRLSNFFIPNLIKMDLHVTQVAGTVRSNKNSAITLVIVGLFSNARTTRKTQRPN